MKLGELYHLAVKEGMKHDPRGLAAAQGVIAEAKKEYRKLSARQKAFFDKERLHNPYSDTRLLYGDPEKEVKKVLIGIDIDVQELLLADRLNEDGAGIDALISHHPRGLALAGLYDVMRMQEQLLVKAGLTQRIAKDMMEKRIGEVERGLHPGNHERAVDAARLLRIPLLCFHTVADNFVASYLQKLFDREKPKTVNALVGLLYRIPEYKYATREKTGPKVIAGDKDSKAGKVLVDMTGGTEGSDRIFARLSQAGIGTLVGMHFSQKHFLKVKDEYINVVVAGHVSSDNLGLNLLFDELEQRAGLTIVTCSGFRRVRRKGKGSR